MFNLGVGTPSDFGGGGGGGGALNFLPPKNYTMPECVILEIEMQRHYGQIA